MLLLTALWYDATRRGMKRWLVDSPTDQHCILTFDKYKKHVFFNLENTNVKREITFDKYKYKNITYSSITFLVFAMFMYWTRWSLFGNDWENICLQENVIDRQCLLDISFLITLDKKVCVCNWPTGAGKKCHIAQERTSGKCNRNFLHCIVLHFSKICSLHIFLMCPEAVFLWQKKNKETVPGDLSWMSH